MSAGMGVSWERANAAARHLVQLLSGGCDRIAVAGSLRRGASVVHDIELVAIPRIVHETSVPPGELFPREHQANLLDRRLGELVMAGELTREGAPVRNGERYKRFFHDAGAGDRLQVDLFVVRPPAEWGPIFAIRTGPADFAKYCVTNMRRYLRRCEDGQVLDFNGHRISCPTEERFFELAVVPFMPAAQRSTWVQDARAWSTSP